MIPKLLIYLFLTGLQPGARLQVRVTDEKTGAHPFAQLYATDSKGHCSPIPIANAVVVDSLGNAAFCADARARSLYLEVVPAR